MSLLFILCWILGLALLCVWFAWRWLIALGHAYGGQQPGPQWLSENLVIKVVVLLSLLAAVVAWFVAWPWNLGSALLPMLLVAVGQGILALAGGSQAGPAPGRQQEDLAILTQAWSQDFVYIPVAGGRWSSLRHSFLSLVPLEDGGVDLLRVDVEYTGAVNTQTVGRVHGNVLQPEPATRPLPHSVYGRYLDPDGRDIFAHYNYTVATKITEPDSAGP